MKPLPVGVDPGVKLNSPTRLTASDPIPLGRAVALLTAVFAIACPVFAYFGYQAHGQAGVTAALVAAAVCLGAGLVALALLAYFRSPQQAFTGVGLAMLFRMAIPMATGVVLTSLGGPLAEGGLFGMIVGFYLVGLLVETFLAVRMVGGSRSPNVSKAA